jgi:soluble lytic murein transglycosylase-like protein
MRRPFPFTVILGTVMACVAQAARPDCIDDAARHHRVNASVLRAIGWQESRLDPEAFHRNANGTTDFGAFQINSVHLSTLRSAGITSQALRDGCVSAYVAAWHYRRQVDRYGNSWRAVGAYHSTSPLQNRAYADGIAGILMSWGVLPPGPLPYSSRVGPPPRRPRSRLAASAVPTAAIPRIAADSRGDIVFDAPIPPRSEFAAGQQ